MIRQSNVLEMKDSSFNIASSLLEPQNTPIEAAIAPIAKESTATLPFRPSHALITDPSESKSKTGNLSDDALHCRNMIAFIGDNPNDDIATRIIELSKVLLSEIPRNETLIIGMLMQCVPVFSVKTGIYASLVGIIHAKHPEFTQKLMDKVIFEFDIDIKRGKYEEAMLLLRFCVALACSNAIKMNSILELLKSFMNMGTSVVLNEKKSFTCDYPVYLALASLPWISSPMYELHKNTIEDLIQQAAFYLSNRTPIWKIPIQYFREQKEGSYTSFNISDRLESAAVALQSMMMDNWKSKTTLRFYQSAVIKPFLEKNGSEENGSTEFTIPSLSLETLEAFSPTKPLESIIRLPITTESVDSILPDHDRWILEEYATSILSAFKLSVMHCAKSLLMIPVQHPQFDYIIVECVISRMLALPKYPSVDPSFDCNFFYFRVLHQLVQFQESLRLVVEKVVHSIVKKIVDLDEECFEILVEFFAYWVSSTGFSWDFDTWLQEGRGEGVVRFVRRGMERLLRLSYRDDLIEKLPSIVHNYIPLTEISCEWLTEEEKAPIEFRMFRNMMRSNLVDSDEIEKVISHLTSFVCKMIGNKHLSQFPRHITLQSDDLETHEPPMKQIKIEEGDSVMKDSETRHSFTEHRVTKEVYVYEGEGEEEHLLFLYNEESEEWTFEQIVSLFVTALLCQGHKTLTHMNRVLNNYDVCLRNLSPSQLTTYLSKHFMDAITERLTMNDSQYYSVIIRTIYNFWPRSSIRITATLKALMVSDILPYTSVFKFLLFDLSNEQQDTTPLSEIFHQIIENALLVKSLHETNYKVAHRKTPRDLTELENCQNCINDALTATRQMILFLLASLIVKYENMESTHISQRWQFLRRILYYGRRYAKFWDIEECLQKLDLPEISEDIQAIINVLRTFKRFYVE